MTTLLLIAHITLMIISLIATVGMTIGAMAGFAVKRPLRRTNLIVTSIGITLGAILLIQNPLGSRCVELTAYVILFAVAYRFVEKRSEKVSLVSLSEK